MSLSPAVRWLLLEGILPLLGANIVYLLLSASLLNAFDKNAKDAQGNPSKFVFSWQPVWDPVAWLYGTCLLAFQLGFASASSSPVLCVILFAAAIACSFQLMGAMHYRGSQQNWKPRRSLIATALILVVVVLAGGYTFKDGAADAGRQRTQTASTTAGGVGSDPWIGGPRDAGGPRP